MNLVNVIMTAARAARLSKQIDRRFIGDGRISVSFDDSKVSFALLENRALPSTEASVGGDGSLEVIITAINALTFTCRNYDSGGLPTGPTFDVYPRVTLSGPTASYNLSSTTGDVVFPRYAVNSKILIFAKQKVFRWADGSTALRWWSWDHFWITCPP